MTLSHIVRDPKSQYLGFWVIVFETFAHDLLIFYDNVLQAWKHHIVEERLNKTAKLNFYWTINEAITDILNKLMKEQLHIFKSTCFRHFSEVQQLQLGGQIIHNLNMCQIYHINRQGHDKGMHFDVFGSLMMMRKLHFSLITGLEFFGKHDLNYSI